LQLRAGGVLKHQTGDVGDAVLAGVADRDLPDGLQPADQLCRLFADFLVCGNHEREMTSRKPARNPSQVVRQVVVGRPGDDMRAVLAEADGVTAGAARPRPTPIVLPRR
jgi:hypothetical protein